MKVCIAEKPSVAREIAEVLGATQRMNGYIEGNGYQVTWTFGHLCTLKEPHEYAENWKRWSLGSLPMIPPRFGIKLIENPTYEQQFKVIESLMQNAEMVINCGDVDKACYEKALAYTPNPGGVGPMTRAMLLQNVVEMAERQL